KPQPVVGSAKEVRPGRAGGGEKHRVVGKRCRPSVRQLRLVGEDDVRAAWRSGSKRLADPRPDVFGDRRESQGEVIFALMVVKEKMFRRQYSKLERRVKQRRGARRGRDREQDAR